MSEGAHEKLTHAGEEEEGSNAHAACMRVHMHDYMHVYMHVHVHVHMHMHMDARAYA